MKSSDIRGWKDIFQFTFKQTMKSKAYQVSFVIMILVGLLAMPIYSYFTLGSAKDENAQSTVTKVYICDKAGLGNVEFSSLGSQEKFKNVEFVNSNEDSEGISKKIDEKEKNAVLLTVLYEPASGFSLELLKAKDGDISDEDLTELSEQIASAFEEYKVSILGLSAEQTTLINSKIQSKVIEADAQGNEIVEEDTSISMDDYWFIYGLLFVVMMVSIFSSSQIATSIVSDKSSRVVEYLLTSVKPMAILVGKILAMLCSVLLQIITLIVLFMVSSPISSYITGKESNDILGQIISSDTIKNINPINVIVCLIVITLSFIFFAILAGLAGSTVSRIQEASDSLSIFTLITLVGVYLAIGAAGSMVESGINGFVYFALLFPISSAYILPGAILIGKANLLIALGAIVLQVIFIYVLLRFTTKVYETLILHNGTKIGLKQLFSISKMSKGGKGHEE